MGLSLKEDSPSVPFSYCTPPEPVWFMELAGGPASGKTHLALSFPNPALLDTEKKGIRILEKGIGQKDKYFIPSNWDDVLAFWSHALRDPDVRTIVVDSSKDILDMAYNATLDELSRKWGRTVDSLYSKEASAVNYRFLNQKMAQLLKDARDHNRNVIFTARLKEVYDAQGHATGIFTRDGWSRAPYHCDFCLQAMDTLPKIPQRSIRPGLVIWRVMKNGSIVQGRYKPYIVLDPSTPPAEVYSALISALTEEVDQEQYMAHLSQYVQEG